MTSELINLNISILFVPSNTKLRYCDAMFVLSEERRLNRVVSEVHAGWNLWETNVQEPKSSHREVWCPTSFEKYKSLLQAPWWLLGLVDGWPPDRDMLTVSTCFLSGLVQTGNCCCCSHSRVKPQQPDWPLTENQRVDSTAAFRGLIFCYAVETDYVELALVTMSTASSQVSSLGNCLFPCRRQSQHFVTLEMGKIGQGDFFFKWNSANRGLKIMLPGILTV